MDQVFIVMSMNFDYPNHPNYFLGLNKDKPITSFDIAERKIVSRWDPA